MTSWIKIGSRYINLDQVLEIRVHERPRFARIHFAGGSPPIDLDEDDSATLIAILEEQSLQPTEVHRTIIAPS